MQTPQNKVGTEHRRYIRLDTVFPVEFGIVSLDGKEVYCEFQQSFTRDVGEGGMCLEVNNLKDELAEKLGAKSAKLNLQINMPFSATPITAVANAAWLKKVKEEAPNKYLIGVSYEQISETERKKIVGYARLLKAKPILTIAALGILVIAVTVTGIQVSRKEALRREAVKKIALIEAERTKLNASLEELKANRAELEKELKEYEEDRVDLEKKVNEARLKAQAKPEEIAKLEAELASARKKSAELSSELSKVAGGKKAMEEQLKVLEEIKASKPVKVTLTSGGVIVGKVVLESTDSVKIEVPTGIITLRRDQISAMSAPTEEEIAGLARERMGLEERTAETKKKMEAEKQKAAEREKANQIAVKKKTGEPGAVISRRIAEQGVVVKDSRIYADGSLFFIKGIAYGISTPGFPPGAEACFSKIPLSVFENDFKMMKNAGINTIRTYEPLPDALLDLADKYGLKVIEQIVYPSAYTDYSSDIELKALKKTAVDVVNRHKNRRCILMWLIWNDAPFSYEEAGSPIPRYGFDKINDFLKEIYLAVKAADNSHPVTGANMLKVKGSDIGFDFLDVIGCNAYLGGHGINWRGKEDAVSTVNELKEISDKYQKPVFITETGYSTFVKKETQDKALRTQIESVGEDLSGIVIFEWTDEWWKAGNTSVQDEDMEEYWGILTWDRKPKPGFEAVSIVFNSIPTDSLGYSQPAPH